MQSHHLSLSEGNNTVASLDLNDNDAEDMLGDISDNELQQYVDEYSGNKEQQIN